MPLPSDDFAYKPVDSVISYEELNLEQPWEQFNVENELTRKGIQKFVSDYKSTLRKTSWSRSCNPESLVQNRNWPRTYDHHGLE